MTDGPNGARGPKFFGANPAACLPCGTGLGATWDQDLLYEAGKLLGQEALSKGSHVLLGPTVNMQRSPLGGRGFESFSEDPVLSGLSSAAIIKGVQSEGVAATVKHFVCNDSEHERLKVDAIVSERALREIYLMPFQLSLRDVQPMCVMTSYNRVNGTHASENPKLLKSVLREDWGFDGLTMSDWFGTYSSADALEAGLDLEMPGPPKTRGEQLSLALNSGKLSIDTIDDSARRVLQLVKKVQDLKVIGDDVESIGATEKISELLRRVATSSIALLKNDGDVLPFEPAKTVRLSIAFMWKLLTGELDCSHWTKCKDCHFLRWWFRFSASLLRNHSFRRHHLPSKERPIRSGSNSTQTYPSHWVPSENIRRQQGVQAEVLLCACWF